MLLFISGGLYKSVLEAVDMKAKAFGLFLKSQRQWACKPLEDFPLNEKKCNFDLFKM
jgi:endonuclease IV